MEVQYNDEHFGWLCENDLILHCHREEYLQEIPRRHRYVPQVDFTDVKIFPRIGKNHFDEDIRAELNSMLACREYIRKNHPDSHRKSYVTKAKKFSRFHD